MACGVYKKASKGLWSKIKGVAKKAWNGAKKAVNWVAGHKDTIAKVANTAKGLINNDKFSGFVDGGLNVMNKGLDTAGKLGIVS